MEIKYTHYPSTFVAKKLITPKPRLHIKGRAVHVRLSICVCVVGELWLGVGRFFFFFFLHIIFIMDTKRLRKSLFTGCHLKKKSRNRYQYTCLNLVGENCTGKTDQELAKARRRTSVYALVCLPASPVSREIFCVVFCLHRRNLDYLAIQRYRLI